jgi:hypothetical protein
VPRIRRSFILHLLKNCPEAREGLDGWREGELTFEEAMMKVAKSLFLANQELQRRLAYAR